MCSFRINVSTYELIVEKNDYKLPGSRKSVVTDVCFTFDASKVPMKPALSVCRRVCPCLRFLEVGKESQNTASGKIPRISYCAPLV